MGIISWVLIIPALGSALMMLLPDKQRELNESSASTFGWIAFIVSCVAMLLSLPIYFSFDSSSAGYQFVEKMNWVSQYGIFYHVGIDGISILLVMLTTVMMPFAVLSSFKYIQHRKKEYYIWLLLLESTMVGAFVALNLFLFYIFWELMLIPMFFLIGIWGGPNRLYATIKFVLFTVIGSLMMLAGIIYLAILAKQQLGGFTFAYDALMKLDLPAGVDVEIKLQ